jgi:hypothetical protein
MNLEKVYILSNIIKKLKVIYNDNSLNNYYINALEIEINSLENENNKNIIKIICNYLNYGDTITSVEIALRELLIDNNNIEIYNFCNRLLKYL